MCERVCAEIEKLRDRREKDVEDEGGEEALRRRIMEINEEVAHDEAQSQDQGLGGGHDCEKHHRNNDQSRGCNAQP